MRNFSIIADGAFALADNEWQIAKVVSNHSNIEIQEFATREQAYLFGICNFSKREYWKTPYRQIPLPRLEDMHGNHWIFCSMDYAGYLSPPIRFFAAYNRDYVGLLDNIDALIGFLSQVPFAEVKECNNIVEAHNILNFYPAKYIMPFGAYITGTVQRYSNIQLNTIVPNIFKNWQEMIQLPDEFAFQKYLPTPSQDFTQNIIDNKSDSQS